MADRPARKTSSAEVTERNPGRVARNRMRIAWMYFIEGLTQHEIADHLGIGRVTVVRNINEARKHREVNIWIKGDIAECLSLERELKDAFGLLDAIVVPEPSDPANTAKSIGAAAGMYTTEQLKDDLVLGVGWGATLYESLQTLAPRSFSGLEVISLLGGIVEARRYNPAEFAWQFANTVGADCYLLTAPAVVDSAETRQALVERCGLNTVFEHARQASMALLSVGTMSPQATSFRFGFLSEQDRTELIREGAVGDLLYNFFDLQGQLVRHPINSRVMSVPIEQLRTIPKRVIASGGLEKVDALLGGMKLVNCNVLITSENTARQMLTRKPV